MNSDLLPIWKGNTVYDEAILPLANADGTIESISMLYNMDSILSVRSADLRTEYVEGIDYKLEDGKLKILTMGNIPIMQYDEYYLAEELPGKCFACTKGGYIYWTENGDFHNRQIVVTYTHKDKWKGIIPNRQGGILTHFHNKVANKQKVNIVFYGDSITEGANSSGAMGLLPYMERWSQLVVNELRERYHHNEIEHINTALGGMTSEWGKENVKRCVVDKKPDLLCVGFGMNDGMRMSTEEYRANIEAIIDTTRANNSECDIVLVATMLPNQEVAGFYGNQEEFLPVLQEIAEKYSNVALADMTTMHKQLLKSKCYFDMTGNNVNHPNDFLIRVYAQVITETLM